MLDNIADLVIVLDPNGHLADFNQAAGQTCGLTPSHLGLPAVQLAEPWASLFREHIATTYQEGELELDIQNVRHIFNLKISTLMDNRKRAVGKLFLLLDITEQKHIQAQIQKLSVAVEQSPASIIITDTDGRIEYVNPRFCQITGYSMQEIIGKNPRLLKSGQTPLKTYQELWATIRSGKEWRGEFINRRKDGTFYTESAVIAPIIDAQRNITHYLAIKEDISELKELQRRDVERAALEERQRLARDLHDAVSQTLFSARLTTEMLIRQKAILPQETIWSHLAHLHRLLVSAMGEMRILLLELRPDGLVNTDLPTLLIHLTDALGTRTEAILNRTLEGEQKSLPDNVKIALYRIAQEALNNVIKHARATQINLALQMDEDGTKLEIRDNGCGFNPQMTVGDHLGLSIMRERAEEIGATLNIHSTPGRGTCITCVWKERNQNE
ncbi:MAG: hypothetical protein DDG60_09330 [Anaerolineae bacterium]|nr:MAG: hypothetical protein DDG60_09330 [Anaerolineae bacterium]